MPANVTPEYERAERRYRQATTDEERLAALQEMLSTVPKHKGTEKMQADIKRRLSQVRKDQAKSAQGKGPDPFHIPKSGAGQVVLAGLPNTGKSSLLVATTSANARTAEYPFTTTLPQPGMWHKDQVPIELVDTPPFTAEHVPPGLMGCIRAADVVCLVVQAGDNVLEQADIGLEVLRERGLTLRSIPQQELNKAACDVRSGMVVVNKVDLATPGVVDSLRELYRETLEIQPVSARTGEGLDDWFRSLWRLLSVIRVYAKQPGKPPDLEKPFILHTGATVADLGRLIHRDLAETMKFARLWGHSRFDGQQVHKTEPLQDRDIVEIHE